MVRLYVGGLVADVTAEQLAERFRYFGSVTACDVRPPKASHTSRSPSIDNCGGFGYIDLEPADDAALRRCLSTVSLF